MLLDASIIHCNSRDVETSASWRGLDVASCELIALRLQFPAPGQQFGAPSALRWLRLTRQQLALSADGSLANAIRVSILGTFRKL
jgi:hypothetical protein